MTDGHTEEPPHPIGRRAAMRRAERLAAERARAVRVRASRIRIGRVTLGLCGLAVTALGALLLFSTVQLSSILGLAIWLAAAVVIHDGIIAPAVFVIGLLLRRATGRRIPAAVYAMMQVAIVVGCVVTLIVVPEIPAKRLGEGIPTLLDRDYAARLAVMWLVIVAGTALAAAAYLAARRWQKVRPATSQR